MQIMEVGCVEDASGRHLTTNTRILGVAGTERFSRFAVRLSNPRHSVYSNTRFIR